MEDGKKIALGATLVAVLAVGVRVGMIYRERKAEENAPAKVAKQERVPEDANVFLKKKRPSNTADLKELDGTTIWVSAGGQMDYYAVSGKHVDYGKKEGTLLGAEPMVIKGAVEQVAPKAATFRVPGGDRQVLLLFTRPAGAQGPGSGDKVFAVPVGYKQGADYTFYTDELFFYDDPHQLYQHWGPEIWKAVDEHRATVGMSEAEVQLALGQVSDSVSQDYGNRRVMFSNLGHPMDVIFVKNKATAVMPHQ